MNRKIYAILAVLVLALQLSGCTALTGETLGHGQGRRPFDRDCRESGDERSGRVNRS